jgi:nucleoside-diphosphate-sugar epimerase
MMLSGSTFLITGATGRLGAELTRRIEELGAGVLPLILGSYPDQPKRIPWFARAEPLRVTRREDLMSLPRPDYVINCHWEVARDLPFAEQLAFEVDRNIRALGPLWDWLSLQKVRSFVNISSIKVFGRSNANPISLETEPRPSTPYGIAKLAAEKFFDAYFRDRGIPVAHLRMCSVMAAGSHPSHLTSQVLASMFHGKRIRINKGHLTYFLYIDDAVDLIIEAAVGTHEGRLNLVSEGFDNEWIAGLFSEIAGRAIDAEYVDLMPGIIDPVFISDIDKVRAGWVRRTPVENAIRKIVQLNS